MDLADIPFPTKLDVTGQEIDVSALTKSQQEFYLNLFKQITDIYAAQNKPRMLIGFTGPPGSGKSVIAALCKQFSKEVSLPFSFATVSVDAFHHTNEYLESHFDPNGTDLKQVKGRYDTYDIAKFIAALARFKSGQALSLPAYSRVLHDPVENAERVSEGPSLLLVEGLWLLFDKSGWEDVRPLLDYAFFVDADKETVKAGVVRRHERGGRTSEEAANYYDAVDARNFDAMLHTKEKADTVIPSYYKTGKGL